MEELIGPDPLAFMKNGPTGFYGLDSGLETIEGLKEEFLTVARCLAHWYIKTDGMRGAPAANLAMERLLPHYPELHGVIKIPPLPGEKPRPRLEKPLPPAPQVEDAQVRQLGAARAPVQLAAADGMIGEGGVNTGEDAGAGQASNKSNPISNVGPPTSQPVDGEQMLNALGFDPNGPTEFKVLRIAPIDSWVFYSAADDAFNATGAQFPGIEPSNNTADAFRHALWSYKIAKTLGAEAAKRLTDAHEVTVPNSDDERLMDLYNNNVGRRLAADPRNQNRSDEEVVLEAIRNGQLQVNPFRIKKAP